MMIFDFESLGEYAAAGLYEEPDRSLFYRKSLGIRRYYEHCELAPYQGKALYPSGVLPRRMAIRPHYLKGFEMDRSAMEAKSPALARAYEADFDIWRSHVPPQHTVTGNMWTHSMPHYERILREGLLSYEDRIRLIADRDVREGLLHVMAGIKRYLERCVAYLQSAGAEESLIRALEQVPLHPARTFYEAVVAWNFVLYLDSCDNLGCLAAGLSPYYRGEDAMGLLQNLYDNLDANDGYSMALNAQTDDPLVLACLEASKGKRRPMIELLVDESTPDSVWQKAMEVVATGNGQPAFYNRQAIWQGLKERFPMIRDEDLNQFCGGGCTETMLAGLSNVGSVDAGVNLLLLLEETLYEALPAAPDFETFYRAYLRRVQATVNEVCHAISLSQRERAELVPLPMRTLLVDDCIDKGLDFNNDGARYRWSIINFAGMINVIDSLLVVRDFVFEQPVLRPEALLERLRANDADFLRQAAHHPTCFGRGNAQADAFAHRLSTDIYSMLDFRKPALGEGFLPASIQFNSQAWAGRGIGATPDGRAAGSPLCDSLAAILSKDINGPTALINSVVSLCLQKALGIPVLNLNITPDFTPDILKALLLAYVRMGGMQMQITCLSAETLQEAYQNPDKHRNLIIRVGGYSEYFHRLPDDIQRMVIDRTIQQMK